MLNSVSAIPYSWISNELVSSGCAVIRIMQRLFTLQIPFRVMDRIHFCIQRRARVRLYTCHTHRNAYAMRCLSATHVHVGFCALVLFPDLDIAFTSTIYSMHVSCPWTLPQDTAVIPMLYMARCNLPSTIGM